MRQSTLLFGQSSSGCPEKAECSGGGDGDREDALKFPAKKPRRAAASKSEERSKKQMQMTLAQNGRLHHHTTSEEDEKSVEGVNTITVDDESEEEEPVRKKSKSQREAASVSSSSARTLEPISLSVKGTLAKETTAHSFFAKRPAPTPANLERGITPRLGGLKAPVKKKWPLQKEAPWPDSSSVHVQPEGVVQLLEAEGQTDRQPRRRRLPSNGTQVQEQDYPWSSHTSASTSSSSSKAKRRVVGPRKTIVSSFISENIELLQDGKMPAALRKLRHEAIDGGVSSKDGLWVDRWRPTRADEVLGNESKSLYLRDWLKELQVTGDAKAGKMIKRVERRKKKPKKGNLDGFIVDDEEEEEAWLDQFRRSDDKEVMSDGDGAVEAESAMPDQLTNAIVLHGPTGSGKTAAVYACAAELGFEVFEIYPGSGRRSGKDLGQAVGDLGRNHMVSSGGTGGGATWKGSKIIKTIGESSNGLSYQPRQSLILLEEVDLLFEEDKGFWTAVVELISTSKRPVVMTCNDFSCVPRETLPIQEVLLFESPNETLAVAYLQMMALCNGHLLQKEFAQSLYLDTAGSTEDHWNAARLIIPASGPLNSQTSLASIDKAQGTASSPDLRQAIMQLQFLCQRPGGGDEGAVGDIFEIDMLSDDAQPRTEDSRQTVRFREEIEMAELRSLCDAALSRSVERMSEIQEPDEYGSSVNDVQIQCASVLYKLRVKMEVTSLATIGREEAYQEALLGGESLSPFTFDTYHQRRWKESERISYLMERLVLSDYFKLPTWVPIVEIAPFVENMIRVDDDEQAVYEAKWTQVLQEIQQKYNESGRTDLNSAGIRLLQMGIRPSRHTIRRMLEKEGDGIASLGKHEYAPCRWIQLEDSILQSVRNNRLSL